MEAAAERRALAMSARRQVDDDRYETSNTQARDASQPVRQAATVLPVTMMHAAAAALQTSATAATAANTSTMHMANHGWRNRLVANLESAPVCERDVRWSLAKHKPDVAFCISGLARTLTVPLVEELLRLHLVQAFGGSNESGMFLHLKAPRVDKAPSAASVSSDGPSIASVERLLHQEWLRPWLREAVVINGSGSTSQPGKGWAARSHAVASDEDAWRTRRANRCSSTHTSPHPESEQRMINDHLGKAWCLRAINRAEERRGRQYDLVIVARPDLLWLRRVTPWCGYDAAHIFFSCPTLGCDMFWAAPRSHADVLLSQADMHRDCTQSCDHGSCCCSYSEALLIYAKEAAAREQYRTANYQGQGGIGWYWPHTIEWHFDLQLGIDIERGAMYRVFHEVRELQELCDHPPIRHHLFGNAVTAHRDCKMSVNKQLRY